MEWRTFEYGETFLPGQEFNSKIIDSEDRKFLEEFEENNLKNLNSTILVCVLEGN